MKPIARIIFAVSTISLVTGGVVALSVSENVNKGISYIGTRATITPTTRRVFVINNTVDGDSWNRWESGVYLYDTSDSSWHTMSQLFGNDYYDGVYYCDIDYSHTKVVISGHNTFDGDGWQSEDIILDDFGTADALKFNAKWDNGKYSRDTTTKTVGVNEGQMQWLLSFYKTCSADTSYGYGAFPQLKATFLDATADDVKLSEAKVRTDDGQYETADVTIAHKLAYLESIYEKYR